MRASRGAGSTGHDDGGQDGAGRRRSCRRAGRRGTLTLLGRGFGLAVGASRNT